MGSIRLKEHENNSKKILLVLTAEKMGVLLKGLQV